MKEFPTIQHVAQAKEDKVLKLWEGLGYYARALNFHYACKTIIKDYQGNIPKNEFINLKGVGKYINAAVQSIGYKKVIPTIDGNVNRVISRIICLSKNPNQAYNIVYQYLKNIISQEYPGDFNQALMDLGRNVCKPKIPLCSKKGCSTNHGQNFNSYFGKS